MIWGVPLAFVGAVFAVLFSLGLKPLPPRYGLALLGKSALIMLGAWGLSAALLPYPVVYLIFICAGILLAFHLQLRSGDLLLSVFAVISALLIPYLTRTSPDLASTIAFWLMGNLLIAMVASWAFFALFPEPATQEPETGKTRNSVSDYDTSRRLFRLALVALPFVVVAFVFDVITPFVLVFVAIQSTQIVANSGSQGSLSQSMLIANAIGGMVAIVVYEALVVVPLLPFALVVILAAIVWFAHRVVSGDVGMMSALTAFLILVGGTLMPFSDDAQTAMVFRLWQLLLAFGYLSIAFAVVDRFFPERAGQITSNTL